MYTTQNPTHPQSFSGYAPATHGLLLNSIGPEIRKKTCTTGVKPAQVFCGVNELRINQNNILMQI